MSPLGIGLLLLLPLGLLSLGGARDDDAGAPSAAVLPGYAHAGEALQFVFSVPSPDLVEVVVAGRITCTVTSPGGSTTAPCDRAQALVEVRAVGSGGREYVFAYNAPGPLGTYKVHFEANSLLTLLPPNPPIAADASFQIIPPGTPLPNGNPDDKTPPGGNDPSATPTPTASPGPSNDAAGGPPGGGGSSAADRTRLFVSSTFATAISVLALVAGRRFGGGIA